MPTADVSPAPTTTPSASPVAGALPPLDAAALESLVGIRVFFAHRSVGAEILSMGIPAVYAAYGVPLPQIGYGVPPVGGLFGDHSLNQTEHPDSKIQDFDVWIRDNGVGAATDIAMMKLGYLDIDAETDVQSVFDSYRSTMDRLEADFPEVTFLHSTVSVTRWVAENDVAIQKFNALMRSQYASTGRLYDLAAVLSTCTDGEPNEFTSDDGDVYYRICDEYTVDGGHLNELGATVAAEELLRLLVSVSS